MANISLHLRDLRGTLIEAWVREFGDLDLVEVNQGDIFSSADGMVADDSPIDIEVDAVVSPANSFGFMDGGIDAVYTHVFGDHLQRDLQEKIESDFGGELPVGQATIVMTGSKQIPWCISAPTMRVPCDVSETANAFLAFRAALLSVLEHNAQEDSMPIKSILCPGLATSIGRMPVERCARQMRAAWDAVLGSGLQFPDHLYQAAEYDRWLTS